MSDLIKFLLGESDFNGFWFGEHPPRKPFFWRNHLRQEWDQQKQRIEELEKNLSESDYVYDQSIATLRSERDELAAKIEDLESQLKEHKHWLIATQKSKNKLAAHVERLRDALEELQDNSVGVAGLHLNGDMAPWDSLRHGGHFESWLIAFDETPHQNLNAIKREVLLLLARDLATTGEVDRSILECIEEYANTKYPSDKDGE